MPVILPDLRKEAVFPAIHEILFADHAKRNALWLAKQPGLHIQVLTTCTSAKVKPPPGIDVPDIFDFEAGEARLAECQQRLEKWRRRAQDLYLGQQHRRLMPAVHDAWCAGIRCEVSILSAGYGLIPGEQEIVPYEVTFATMPRSKRIAWAERLGIPAAFRAFLSVPADLKLLLLSEPYMDAVQWDGSGDYGAPTALICSPTIERRMKTLARLLCIPLGNRDAQRLSCGLIAAKGEVAARVLRGLAAARS